MVDTCASSVALRSARTKSRAVEESRPRVELSGNDIKHVRELVQEYLLVPRGNAGTKSQCLAY